MCVKQFIDFDLVVTCLGMYSKKNKIQEQHRCTSKNVQHSTVYDDLTRHLFCPCLPTSQVTEHKGPAPITTSPDVGQGRIEGRGGAQELQA